jgi:flagellar biosynthesis regulator FlbT
MARLLISIPEQEAAEIRQKAKSLGLTTSAYVRNTVKDSMNKDTRHNQILKAIRALVPTLAEALGRTQNVSAEMTQKLSNLLVEMYDRRNS